MAVTSITLTDPVSGYSVPILPADGVAATSLEVEPVVRVVAEDRVGGNGSFDTTTYLSAATVTLNLLLYGEPATVGATGYGATYQSTYGGVVGMGQAAFMDALGPLLSPAARPYLIVTDDDWLTARQLTVRLDSMQKIRSDPTNWPVQINWVAPNGVWESAVEETAAVPAFVPSTTGLDFSSSGLDVSSSGVDMPPSSSDVEFILNLDGTAATAWVIDLYGPCTGPKIANDTTGMTLEFTDDVVLGAGQYIELTLTDRSANLLSDPSQSQLSNLIFSTATWAPLQPGVNLIRFYPTSAGDGSEAVVAYRAASAP